VGEKTKTQTNPTRQGGQGMNMWTGGQTAIINRGVRIGLTEKVTSE